jgi:hypothetical protein
MNAGVPCSFRRIMVVHDERLKESVFRLRDFLVVIWPLYSSSSGYGKRLNAVFSPREVRRG